MLSGNLDNVNINNFINNRTNVYNNIDNNISHKETENDANMNSIQNNKFIQH